MRPPHCYNDRAAEAVRELAVPPLKHRGVKGLGGHWVDIKAPSPVALRGSADISTHESVQLLPEIKNSAADFHWAGPFPLQSPHS